ncbi:MAG: DUF2520 domain-containing protein [Polyangiaceae bacterium]
MTASVLVLGRGKVGTAIARGVRRARTSVKTVSVRAFLESPRWPMPRRSSTPPLVVIAARDALVEPVAVVLAKLLREALHRPQRAVVLHVAGALGTAPLASLASLGVATGVAHPLVSILEGAPQDALRGAALVATGDARALAAARSLARSLSMRFVAPRALEPAAYHAAAALLANGAVALASVSEALLVRAGLAPTDVASLLAPLLRSVAGNLGRFGVQPALTGPIRRGDSATVARHLGVLRTSQFASDLGLYVASGRVQLRLSRDLGEASAQDLTRIEELLNLANAAPP